MLSLSRRSCRIGPAVRVKITGKDERVTTLAVPLSQLMLDPNELNSLLQEPHAHQVLFDTKRSTLIEPVFRNIAALRLVDKIEDASVTLELNSTTTLSLVNCTLARIELEPQNGGLTAMSLSVQCTPKLDSMIARLLEKLDCDAEAELHGNQQELPLSEGRAADEVAAARAKQSVEKRLEVVV